MRLLIVEDNGRMRGLIGSIVADLAESVTECGDSGEALRAYTACTPDWVLIDIRMSRLDGLAATSRIKEALPDAKVVTVTDFNASLREAARKAEAWAYVLIAILRAPLLRAGFCKKVRKPAR